MSTGNKKILAMIMAGGKGTRLYPLTKERAKPAVPFGGKYRIIDFVLTNLVNSGINSIYVLTQFKAQSLMEHMKDGWRFGSLLKDQFVTIVPAQMRTGEEWYQGTADAIYQNLNLIKRFNPDIVAIFGADHIYRMNIRQMIDFHVDNNADATVSAMPMPLDEASDFGVIQVDKVLKVKGFQEKPKNPSPMPEDPEKALISMGNYLFNADFLIDILEEDAKKDTDHDFGKTILPGIYETSRLFAYDFMKNDIPGVDEREKGYWRDVGTIKAYWEANMDLKKIDADFNLYNSLWPIRTASYGAPPAKFCYDKKGMRGSVINSVVAEGCIIRGAKVQDSVLGRNVHIHSNASIINSIIMDGVKIGEGCKINMAIIDKDVNISPGTEIGYNYEEDKRKYFMDEESSIVVIPKDE
ncbi:MAG: glucose-1-phosphate adenylyltransferase [Proteobacteria bacterium]|nr:glucose-1-phosphate adenylyltransferase [Pseudomonadota bacterium]